jgi:hypothetical protein
MQEDTKTTGDECLSWYSLPASYGSSLGLNPDTLSNKQKGRHEQRSSQHTLAREKRGEGAVSFLCATEGCTVCTNSNSATCIKPANPPKSTKMGTATKRSITQRLRHKT